MIVKRDYSIQNIINLNLTYDDGSQKLVRFEDQSIIRVKFVKNGDIITEEGRVNIRIYSLREDTSSINIYLDCSEVGKAKTYLLKLEDILDVDVLPIEPQYIDSVETPIVLNSINGYIEIHFNRFFNSKVNLKISNATTGQCYFKALDLSTVEQYKCFKWKLRDFTSVKPCISGVENLYFDPNDCFYVYQWNDEEQAVISALFKNNEVLVPLDTIIKVEISAEDELVEYEFTVNQEMINALTYVPIV